MLECRYFLLTNITWAVILTTFLRFLYATTDEVEFDYFNYNAKPKYEKQPRSQKELAQKLRECGYIRSYKVATAMTDIDRKYFMSSYKNPYADESGKINVYSKDHLKFTIITEPPYVVAYILEQVKDCIVYGSKVMVVGSGTGYVLSCMYSMLDHENGTGPGYVVAFDLHESILETAYDNIDAFFPASLPRINLFLDDGLEGHKDYEPFNVIYVSFAMPKIPPELLSQLSFGGKMVIPIGPENGTKYLTVVERKINGAIVVRKRMLVEYQYYSEFNKSQLVTTTEEPSFEDYGLQTMFLEAKEKDRKMYEFLKNKLKMQVRTTTDLMAIMSSERKAFEAYSRRSRSKVNDSELKEHLKRYLFTEPPDPETTTLDDF